MSDAENGGMTKLSIFLAAALIGAAALAAQPGRFVGKVVVELLDDVEYDHKLKLLEDFGYEDPAGKLWLARKGGILDGSPIPDELRSLGGVPVVGDYRKASIVHDYFCRARTEPWKQAHRMLYSASLAEGLTPPEAKLLYLAVYAGGWRWEVPGSSCYASCHASAASLAWKPAATQDELRPLVAWINEADPGLEDIERKVDGAIRKPGPHFFAQR